MQFSSTSDGLEPASNAAQRPIFTRDRTGSTSASTSLASPPPVDPEPAYIAASAASQIVTSDHQNQTEDWFEERGDKFGQATAVVSPTSLALVNAFLDQLLFNFLASARSTSIASLRPAVSEVLKPRLAKDAINGADEELHEFLGGGDEEELSAFHNGLEPKGVWDLNLIWRRTRLRCMVYTRLGDMEEEDEESFVERERLEERNEGHRRLSRNFGIVSPAAAIFLTSILEFVGEQALIVAGEAAYTRAESQQARTVVDGTPRDSGQRVRVEDTDMEKIALNTTLGRLWRSWKKRVRSPSTLGARAISRESARGKGVPTSNSNPTSSQASISEVDAIVSGTAVVKVKGKPHPSRSPLSDHTNRNVADNAAKTPVTRKGFQEDKPTVTPGERRPSSMVVYPPRDERLPLAPPGSIMQRRRSSSVPTFYPVPNVYPSSDVFATLNETPESFNNSSQSVHEQGKRLPAAPTADVPSVPAAVATMYDGELHPGEIDQNTKRTAGAAQETPGMSKEEFDRQMLELVREMKPRSTPDMVDLDDQVSSDVVEKTQRQTGHEERSNGAESSGAINGDQGRSAKPAGQGVDRSTIEYWRGTRDASNFHEKVEEKMMQGGGSRAASGDTVDNKYGRRWERQAPYFHQGPPASRQIQEPSTTSGPGKVLPIEDPVPNSTAETVRAQEADNGAPSLTPLRELMEAAHDTSDEASSLAPSQDASRPDYNPSERLQYADLPQSGSSSSRTVSQPKPASKLSDVGSQLPVVNTGTDRAAVQRVMPSPVSTREPLTPIGRTSTSSNRDLRPVQTSSSGTSQVSQKLKGLVGRDSSDAKRPGISRRSSEGSGSMASDKRSLSTPKVEDAQRNFDQLIKSDETIQYTLTPQNMREMEIPDSPRWNQKRADTAALADFLRKTGPEDSESTRPMSGRSKVSLKGLNGLRSHSVSNAKPPELARPTPQAIPIQAQVPSRPSTSHSQAGVARDARTKDESVREFADFLRSTGPAPGTMSPQNPGPPIAEPRPLKALPATSPRPPSQQGAPKKIVKPNPSTVNQPMVNHQMDSTAPRKPPPKLQAREAAASSDSTSDLANFIRQGPADRSEGRLQLPRTGEPSHPAAETNGVLQISNGKPKEADNSRVSVASTQLSSAPSKSVISVNSRTGLLDSSIATSDSRQRTSGSRERRSPRYDDSPHPVRKQRRATDPYAIDTDSEGDEAYQPPPQKQEESLIDFLNSVTPPPTPSTSQMPFTNSPQNFKSLASHKSHYPSMRERLTRNGVSSGNTKTRTSPPSMGVPSVSRGKSETRQPASTTARGKAPMQQSFPGDRGRPEAARSDSADRIRSQAPRIPPLPRETSPHLITQIGTKFDSYRITSPTYAAHVDRDRKGPRRPSVQHQPRGEREPGSDISDLAEFLKNSGPPTTVPAPRPVSPIKEREKEGGFGRMFSRRKKSVH